MACSCATMRFLSLRGLPTSAPASLAHLGSRTAFGSAGLPYGEFAEEYVICSF